jgi:hypothetical protein
MCHYYRGTRLHTDTDRHPRFSINEKMQQTTPLAAKKIVHL